MKPAARKNGLVVRELADEVVVYDQERHEAHCLNSTAATVFRNADGRRDIADLARLVAPGEDVSSGEAVVRMALERLGEAHLLEGEPIMPPDASVSRRDAIRRVGLGAAVLLPLVTSILAPTPAEAAATCVNDCTGQPDGTPCSCFGFTPCTWTCSGAGGCSDGGLC